MKDWRVDIHSYPRQDSILAAARHIIVGSAETAAEVFSDEYRGEFKHLEEDERHPCVDCHSLALYFCYLTGTECRKWARWLESWAR